MIYEAKARPQPPAVQELIARAEVVGMRETIDLDVSPNYVARGNSKISS